MEPGASGNPVLAFPCFVSSTKGPGNHMQNKVSRHCLEGERIREGKGKVPQGQPPGAWELLPAAREMSAPPGSPRDLACVPAAAGCMSHPPRYRVRVCRPGVLARCVSAILRPRPQGKDPHCPHFTNEINKAEDSEQLAGDKDGLEKPISFPGPSLGSLFVPLFACFHGSN